MLPRLEETMGACSVCYARRRGRTASTCLLPSVSQTTSRSPEHSKIFSPTDESSLSGPPVGERAREPDASLASCPGAHVQEDGDGDHDVILLLAKVPAGRVEGPLGARPTGRVSGAEATDVRRGVARARFAVTLTYVSGDRSGQRSTWQAFARSLREER